MRKKSVIILLLLTLFPLPAVAAFSDAWEAMAGAGKGLTLTVDGGELAFLNGSDEALDLAESLLAPLQLSLYAGPEGADEDIVFVSDGDVSFSSRLPRESAGVIPGLRSVQAARELFTGILPRLFDDIGGEEPPEIEERGTNFQVLGYSPQRKSLIISREQYSFLPAGALGELRAALSRVFQDLPAAEQINAYLQNLTMDGELTFRRNLNADGSDMAFQFGGRISSGGADIRKLTFVIGQTGKLFYLSVRAPAAKGNNSFQFVLTCPVLKETAKKNTLEMTLDTRRTFEGDVWTRKDTLSAINKKNKGENITVTLNREEKAGGIKQTWKITLTAAADTSGTLSGKAVYLHKHAASKVLECSARFSLSPGKSPVISGLSGTGDSPGGFPEALLNALLTKMKGLDPKEQLLLNHLLRTGEWMNGPSVPPLPETDHTEV